MTDWDIYSRRITINGNSVKEIQINSIKNFVLNDFVNIPSFFQIKINGIIREVNIVEESSIIKNPNKKLLLCKPNETINIGDIVEFDNSNWICLNNDTTSEIYDTGIIQRCNNILKFYDNNHILHQIPCIVNSSVNLSLDENQYISIPDSTIIVRVSANEITKDITRNQIYNLSGDNFKVIDINRVVENGLLVLKMEYVVEQAEEHVYTLTILNGNSVNIQKSTTLQLNVNLYDNGILVSPLPPLIFTSSNKTICTVDSNGMVTALSAIGSCVVTVSLISDSSISQNININVIDVPQNNYTYELTSISLPDDEITVTQTKSYIIQKYNNGIPIAQTFTFNVVGDVSTYQLTVIDGNNCTIKALKSNIIITLQAIDDSDISKVVNKEINLKNLF